MRLLFVIGRACREAERFAGDVEEIHREMLSPHVATIVKVAVASRVAESNRFVADVQSASSTRLSPTASVPLSSPHFCTC